MPTSLGSLRPTIVELVWAAADWGGFASSQQEDGFRSPHAICLRMTLHQGTWRCWSLHKSLCPRPWGLISAVTCWVTLFLCWSHPGSRMGTRGKRVIRSDSSFSAALVRIVDLRSVCQASMMCWDFNDFRVQSPQCWAFSLRLVVSAVVCWPWPCGSHCPSLQLSHLGMGGS